MGGLGYLDEADSQFAANQEIAEYSGSGTLLKRYIRLPGSIDETFLMIDVPSGTETWAHADRQGSVIATTDSSGAVVDQYRYLPYGRPGSEGASGFPFRYTGQKLDPETGLYYYKARYYDPETGRFLQTDPIGYDDQMNLYAYVGNDPVNRTDPTVMCDRFSMCKSAPGPQYTPRAVRSPSFVLSDSQTREHPESGAAQGIDDPKAAADTVDPGTRYTIPPQVVAALEQIFADPDFPDPDIESITVTYSPTFVRIHLAFIPGSKGSVTRPGRIHTNLGEDELFSLDAHVLHEFYHVVQQWGREDMSRLGYLLRARKRERETNDFAQKHLNAYRKLLKRARAQ